MLSWVYQIFGTSNDKYHAIGRRALYNLITHNRDYPYLLENSIERCYVADPPKLVVDPPKTLESYFEVVSEKKVGIGYLAGAGVLIVVRSRRNKNFILKLPNLENGVIA